MRAAASRPAGDSGHSSEDRVQGAARHRSTRDALTFYSCLHRVSALQTVSCILQLTLMEVVDMKLYEFIGAPNPRRVRIFLAEKGITIPSEQIDIAAGKNRAP